MLTASVVITTHSRREDTLRAVASALAQVPEPEVLVFDDASEDGTADALRERHPQVRVFPQRERTGYIVLRNRGFREATGDIVFSIDDDAYFSGADTIERVLALFRGDAKVCAVAIPFVEPLQRQSLSSLRSARPNHRPGDEVRSYIGCAHAIRRGAALEAGGYREFFEHQGEERDLCIRLRDRGLRIVHADCDPIVHMVSPRRDTRRQLHFGVRNTILFDLINAPFPHVVPRVVLDALALLRYRFQLDTLPLKSKALLQAFAVFAANRGTRGPVARETWKRWRELPSHGSLSTGADAAIPPPAGAPARTATA